MYAFTAKGHGAFPVDMLRYDRCTPRTSRDSREIERSLLSYGSGYGWEVELVTERKSITVDRWASFGCSITTPERAA